MKKGKLLSVLTSLAMTSSMILSAVPFTASASASSLGLTLNAEGGKTSYTLDEIKAGARAKVYIDVESELSESDNVKAIEFGLKTESWGKVDPINLSFSDPNVFMTSKTDSSWIGDDMIINPQGSTILSKYEAGKKPTTDAGYSALETDEYSGDGSVFETDTVPNGSFASDSTKGAVMTGGEGQHFAEFEVAFPTNLAAGKYTIDFVPSRTRAMVMKNGDFTGKSGSDYSPITNTKSITFTIGDGEVQTTAATTADTTATSKAPVKHEYDGEATLKVEKGVKGAVGEEVFVPIYMELGSGLTRNYVEGFGFKVVYDTTALQLQEIQKPSARKNNFENGLSGANMSVNAELGTVMFAIPGEGQITVDPTKPCAVAKFTVLPGAKAENAITLQNTIDPNKEIEIVHYKDASVDAVYLKPTVVDGSVVLGEVSTAATTTAVTTSTSTSKSAVSHQYDGSATLDVAEVDGEVGKEVFVPVYLQLENGLARNYIEGFGFKAVYDKSALQLDEIQKPSARKNNFENGLSGANMSVNNDLGTVMFAIPGEGQITVDGSKPCAVLKFTVLPGAKARNEITLENTIDPNKEIEIVHYKDASVDAVYLKPTVDPGAVVLAQTSESSTTVSSSQAVPTETSISYQVVVETSVSKQVVVETSISYQVVPTTETSISKQIVVETEVSKSMVVETEVSKSMVVETSVSYSVVPSTETSISKQIIVETEISKMVVPETSISYIVVPSTETSISYQIVVETSVSKSVVIETELSTTATSGNGDDPTVTSVSFDITPELDGENVNWYYADHDAWNVAGIKAYIGGVEKELTVDDLVFTFDGKEVADPGEVYNGKTFDYTITVALKDYPEQTAEMAAKIGLRGDANTDHKANVRDAASMAKDLAQLYKSKKTTLTAEDGFGIFLGNADMGKSEKTPAYAPYDISVRDSAAEAKWLARQYKEKDLTLYDVAVLKK